MADEHDEGRNPHEIFVDGTGESNRQRYEDDVVDAVTIIEAAGYQQQPDQYVLEALRGANGPVEEQFDPRGDVGPAEVDLTHQHRKFFRVTTRGQVFV